MNMRIRDLIMRDNTHPTDMERHSLLYLFGGIKALYEIIDNLYDFEEHCIIPEYLKRSDLFLSSQLEALIKIGFNLFNGYPADIYQCFSVLEEPEVHIVLDAIKIRFGFDN